MSKRIQQKMDAPSHSPGHEPVLLRETLSALQVEKGGLFLDATFGGGGHSRAILASNEITSVCALDRDPSAQARAATLKKEFSGRFHFFRINFTELDTLSGKAGQVTSSEQSQSDFSSFDAALFDLGVSSFQFDQAERGFSFRQDAHLDMRMDPSQGLSAAEFLETAPEEELVRALRDYAEEPSWRRMVRVILENRGNGSLQRTSSFADLVSRSLPGGRKVSRIHPATRIFQGIRIAVNGELTAIEQALPVIFDHLVSGGRLVVISFHSLEDRIVKRFFRRCAGRPEHRNDQSVQDERVVRAMLPHTRPILPSAEERVRNPRSRSAKLRTLIKKGTP